MRWVTKRIKCGMGGGGGVFGKLNSDEETPENLEAIQPHLHDYPHMPTDHRHTDKQHRLVMGAVDRHPHTPMDGCCQFCYLPASL